MYVTNAIFPTPPIFDSYEASMRVSFSSDICIVTHVTNASHFYPATRPPLASPVLVLWLRGQG